VFDDFRIAIDAYKARRQAVEVRFAAILGMAGL